MAKKISRKMARTKKNPVPKPAAATAAVEDINLRTQQPASSQPPRMANPDSPDLCMAVATESYSSGSDSSGPRPEFSSNRSGRRTATRSQPRRQSTEETDSDRRPDSDNETNHADSTSQGAAANSNATDDEAGDDEGGDDSEDDDDAEGTMNNTVVDNSPQPSANSTVHRGNRVSVGRRRAQENPAPNQPNASAVGKKSTAVPSKAKKKKKSHIFEEIAAYQLSTQLLLSKAPFQR